MSLLQPPPPVPPGLTPSISLLPHPYAYVICFALHGPPSAYRDFFEELQECDAWMHYVQNAWIVLSRRPLMDLAKNLRGKIRTGDWLMVMPAKGPVDGWLPKEAWEWINKHVPREW
jgi:hypothetical protein